MWLEVGKQGTSSHTSSAQYHFKYLWTQSDVDIEGKDFRKMPVARSQAETDAIES